MQKNDVLYNFYIELLQRELKFATGCTEPIAIAYCAAKAKDLLGLMPTEVKILASGNVIKNAKSVVVPNTGGLKGVISAAAAGIIVGKPCLELQILNDVSDEQKQEIRNFIDNTPISLDIIKEDTLLCIKIMLRNGENSSMVEIRGTHTNIVRMEKDGFVVLDNDCLDSASNIEELYNEMTVQSIYDFACALDTNDIKDCLLHQVEHNYNIAMEGLKGQYGANIGRVILETEDDNVRIRAKAIAAAGSDARMSGSEMPVVINSGSGNQGITVSLPVYEYSKHLKVDEATFIKALAISNLVAMHIKRGIGSLSAFCGAVSAGCGAGAGIAFLHGCDYNCIAHTVSNSLGILSGTICDGAKASCAAKIAYAVDAGIVGYFMYTKGKEFYRGDGIISSNVEKTIKNIYRLGKLGMAQTDKEILSIMTDNVCD